MNSELEENFDILSVRRPVDISSERLANFKVNNEKEALVDNIVAFLGKIVSLRSPYTADHSSNVKNLALKLALQVNFQVDRIESLGHAAMLHDIGKIVIREYITNKPTRLTEDEYLTMKQHTWLGYEMIQPLNLDPLIGNVILYHHESYDGNGYLAGLKGAKIPLEACIIKIADTYAALTSARPYRVAYSPEQAIEILKEEHRSFDPFLLNEFLKLVGNAHLESGLAQK